MKCDSCGVKTGVNFGNGNAVLCKNCSTTDEGKKKMATNSKSVELGGIVQSGLLEASGDTGADYQTGILIAKAVSAIGWVTCFIAFIIILMRSILME